MSRSARELLLRSSRAIALCACETAVAYDTVSTAAVLRRTGSVVGGGALLRSAAYVSGPSAGTIRPGAFSSSFSGIRCFSLFGFGSSGSTKPFDAEANAVDLSTVDIDTAGPTDAQDTASAASDAMQATNEFEPSALVELAATAEILARTEALEGAWAPTRAMQNVLTTLHDSTGLPWWQTIVLTTFLVRTMLLPLLLRQISTSHRMSKFRPEFQDLTARFQDRSQIEGQDMEVLRNQYYADTQALYRKYNVNPFVAPLAPLANLPFLIGFMFALRNMSLAKVPSLTDGGVMWFADLSVADPTLLLPVMSAATMLINIELNAADGMQGQDPQQLAQMKWIMRGLAVLTLPATYSFPAADHIYWFCSNLFSLGVTQTLRLSQVRRFLGLSDAASGSAGVQAAPAAVHKKVLRPTAENLKGKVVVFDRPGRPRHRKR